VVCTSDATVACDVRCTRARDADRRTPHERAIEGPAAYPMKAPATAPTGPNTTAPDTAPSAASPARSWAFASNEMSEPAISAPITKILMASSPANNRAQLTGKMRRHEVANMASALHEKARDRVPGAGLRILRCSQRAGDLPDVSTFLPMVRSHARERRRRHPCSGNAITPYFTRRPWKKPLLVVFCRILAESPCSLVFWV
jgi:hypothetical protein